LFIWERDHLHPNVLKQTSPEEWAELYGYMRSSNIILNAPPVVSEVIALGKTPVESGQTMFFYNVRPYPETLLTDISYEQVRADGYMWTKLMNRQLERQKFDLVITVKGKFSFYDYDILPKYYTQISEITVDMPNTGEQYTMLIWKPTPQ
jgi:hypothetical protein